MKDLALGFTPEGTAECPHKAAKALLVQQLQVLREHPEACLEWDFEQKENRNALLAFLLEDFFSGFDFEAALKCYQHNLRGQRFSSYQFWCIQIHEFLSDNADNPHVNTYNELLKRDMIASLEAGMRNYNAALWVFIERFVFHFQKLHGKSPSLAELQEGLENQRLVRDLARLSNNTLVALDESGALTEEPNYQLQNNRLSYMGTFPEPAEVTTGCPALFVPGALSQMIEGSKTLIFLEGQDWEINFGKSRDDVLRRDD